MKFIAKRPEMWYIEQEVTTNMNQIVELYPPERLAWLRVRIERTRKLLWALAIAAAAACVALCLTTDNFNLYRRLAQCIAVSVGAGWLIIYFGTYVVRDGRRELEHAANLTDEREQITGTVTVLRQKVRLRSSITLRKVRVENEDGSRVLNVHIDKADQLRRAGERLTLYVSHGYITAYEVAE